MFNPKSDFRYDYLSVGFVTANEKTDTTIPKGLGMVRVQVPGLLEPESCSALPIGAMYGVHNGIHWVPEVNANVVVFFREGHLDHPYYMAGPWGAPADGSDQPEQTDNGDPDHVVVRWRNFYIKVNGKEGQERLTVEDLNTGTKVDFIRSTKNFERTVMGDEVATIKKNLTETIQEGDETHTVMTGKRTTVIAQDDIKTVGGSDTKTILQSETKAVTLASTEVVGTVKSISALSILLSAGANVSLTAGGVLTMLANGITQQSSGPSTSIAVGLKTNTFLGGILESVVGGVVQGIVGALTQTVAGLYTITVAGIFKILGADIQLGVGTPKKLLNEDIVTYLNAHTHTAPPLGGPTSAPIDQITPGGVPYDRNVLTTSNVKAS